MSRYALLRAATWALSLLGAALFAAAIAALATGTSGLTFLAEIFRKLPGIVLLDPGPSAVTGAPALTVAAPALAASAALVAPSLVLALLAGPALARLLAGARRRSPIAAVFQLVASVPVFCVALLIAAALAAFGTPPAGAAGILAMVFTIGFAAAGAVALCIAHGYAVAAPASYAQQLSRMGLSRRHIVRRYLAPPALIIALRDAGNVLLLVFAATAIVEAVFAWPGAGAGFLRGVALRDWNVVALLILILAALRFTLDLVAALVVRAALGEEPPA